MTTASPPPAPARATSLALGVSLLLLLAGWSVFLRWPTFGAPLWNVDEGIHSAIARTLLDGGVLYRDAVDQRTPLTYYAVALLFRVFGENNLWALRAAVAVIIGGTAFGLFLIGRRIRGAATGGWAALLLCALSSSLLWPGDGNAVTTEWFLMLFTTWGTWGFWRIQPRADFRATLPVGVLYGLAFLSKQPALLDLGAPILTLGYLAATGERRWADAIRAAAGLLAGCFGVIVLVFGYFVLRGAFGDLVFDTWTYNVLYYGPDVTLAQRLLSVFVPFNLLARHYPQVLLALLAAFALQLFRLVQLRATPEEKSGRPWLFYLSVWDLTSLAGAISGGRAFEHYYVQCFPAFALSAACLLASAGAFARRRWLGQGRSSLPANAAAVLAALLVTITGLSLFTGPLSHRGHVEYPRDSAMSASRFIHALTAPEERIFVWGYNPDIYLYTDRKPASRYVYCSFQTGLIPWTNIEPDKDTAYAIVPGAMDALLADLRKRHPVFFVDCSLGQDRNFSKYPVAKFAPLEAFVTENYLEVESAQFVPEGFRLHLITDRARLTPVRLAGGTAGRPEAPKIFGPALAGTVPTPVLVEADDPDGRLQRLELRAGDTLIDSVSFQPTHGITVQFVLPFNRLKPGPYRLVARAVSANGATHDSPEFAIASAASAVTRDQLPKYGLPCVTTTLMPLTVRAPFAPSVAPEDGHRVIALHAPSLLSFTLPADVRRVTGGFGIRPGAYAPENPYPTDGAEFFVEWVSKGEERHVLLHRWLQPRDHPEDRPIQFFSVDVPVHPAGSRLEFVITPGPYGRNASDWTFWTDLEAATSR